MDHIREPLGNGNQLVAEYVRDICWSGLPNAVQTKVRHCLLDALGAVLSGTLAPASQITGKYAPVAFRGAEATLLLRNQQATAAGAAFANAYAANGFDGDDAMNFTKGHPGAQLFPSALAVAEKLNLSGADLLTAMVVGYEVAGRAGLCWHDHHDIYQACGSWGSVACAAAAAHLQRLTETQIQHALGIAEYHAPNLPMLRDMDDPAMVKCGMGWGAFTGVTSAELAELGFTGIPSLLGFEKYHVVVADIGQNYRMIDNVWFKEFTCCGFAHAAILAAQKLLQETSLTSDDIEQVQVECDHFAVQLGSKLPTNTEEAQFNTAWPLAAFLLEGEVGPRQMAEERIHDENMVSLAQRIKLAESPQLSEWADMRLKGIPGGKYATRVEIALRNGQRLDSGYVEAYSNDYGLYTDPAWFENKFRWLVQDVIRDQRADELVGLVWAFDQAASVRQLVELVRQ